MGSKMRAQQDQRTTIPMRLFTLASTALLLATSPTLASAQGSPVHCDLSGLPATIQATLQSRVPAWRIQQPADLGPDARETWKGTKPPGCPGVAVGKFENSNVSYAVLLVPVIHPDSAYKFLALSTEAPSKFTLTVIEEWKGRGASNYFLHTERVKKWFDSNWIRKLYVEAEDGILFVDAGSKEFEADLYFSADGRFQHDWVDY